MRLEKGTAMTTATLSQIDLRIRDAALQQLEWDSQVDASGIGVTARDDVVTLTGFIDSYAGKLAAERAVKRVRGVRAVANDLQVTGLERTDTDIATDTARALDLRITLPSTVQAVVHHGHVTLTGTVHTLFQRAVAEKALRYIRGIKGIVNRIVVMPTASATDIRPRIVRALHQDADVDARGIEVLVSGSTVTLTGTVRSWHERISAERAAMHAPGITHVDNRISVVWPEQAEPRAQDELC
jgi:osmotically-inducible protein OsmY